MPVAIGGVTGNASLSWPGSGERRIEPRLLRTLLFNPPRRETALRRLPGWKKPLAFCADYEIRADLNKNLGLI
jgi:hypothetical protein